MPAPPNQQRLLDLSRQRLAELLSKLADKHGLSQQGVATRAGLPAQYLSDIKRGRRPMTELVARRLGEEFQVGHLWLLGRSDAPDASPLSRDSMASDTATWLPVLATPCQGRPHLCPQWDGAGLYIGVAMAAKLAVAKEPYVLKMATRDVQGRLRAGDLLLMSQDVSPAAEIVVIKYRQKLLLARRRKDGRWQNVATGKTLIATCPIVGHCVGILWGSLYNPTGIADYGHLPKPAVDRGP